MTNATVNTGSTTTSKADIRVMATVYTQLRFILTPLDAITTTVVMKLYEDIVLASPVNPSASTRTSIDIAENAVNEVESVGYMVHPVPRANSLVIPRDKIT